MALFQRGCVRHANAQRGVSRNVKRGDRPCESGLASLELAIFLPVLLFLALGTVQFAQIFIAERHLRAAAYSGARTGTIQNSNVAQVESAIATYLGATHIGTNFETEIDGVGVGADGDTMVQVKVKHDFPLLFRMPGLGSPDEPVFPITVAVTMRHE